MMREMSIIWYEYWTDKMVEYGDWELAMHFKWNRVVLIQGGQL